MPHQKLPVIRVGADLIHDSDRIRHYLEERGARFEARLTTRERALARAIIRMAEELRTNEDGAATRCRNFHQTKAGITD